MPRTQIDGYRVTCSKHGTLTVFRPFAADDISVLPRGTHAALDVLGAETKRRIVVWWRSVR
jgi:hypothetical protein